MSEQHLEGLRGSAGVSPSRSYPRQRAESSTEALVAQLRVPETKLRSPLPSAREIDAALEAKYGARRYREV